MDNGTWRGAPPARSDEGRTSVPLDGLLPIFNRRATQLEGMTRCAQCTDYLWAGPYFTAPAVMPRMNCFCVSKNMTTMGSIDRIEPAATRRKLESKALAM